MDILGKKVKVKLNESGKRRLMQSFNYINPPEEMKGEIMNKTDWLVGCPVFASGDVKLGVGYECEVIEVI